MWAMELEQLDGSVLDRVPIRDDDNELYFPTDTFQAMPADGYTAIFRRLLDHENIELKLHTAFVKGMEAGFDHCFNSMAIDEFFDFDLGRLPYRSIRFHSVSLPMPFVLPVAVVNFTHHLPYTRITEWKHFPAHGDGQWTTVTYEQPCAAEENADERYYPVKDVLGTNRELYKGYLTRVPERMTFIGRCGQYVYLDMHQAVSAALAVARRYLQRQSQASARSS
jgi:UDP-galactopyranose mutase